MKIIGYILLVFGALSTTGSALRGISPVGGLLFVALGILLIVRAKHKDEDKKQKKEWEETKLK